MSLLYCSAIPNALFSVYWGVQKRKRKKNRGTILLTTNYYVKEEKPKAKGRGERGLRNTGRKYRISRPIRRTFFPKNVT
jgi:hypothetical protein